MGRQDSEDDLVRLKLIGSMEAVDSTGRNLLPASRKPRALLSYLALNADQWVPRARLTRLLWDRVPEEQGRASLRQSLHELSRSMGLHFSRVIEPERERMRLKADQVSVDALVVATPDAADVLDVLSDLSVFSGSLLLEGFDNLSDEFDHWLVAERLKFEERIRRWSEARIDVGRQEAGVPAQRLDLARKAVAADPTNENAVRQLMRQLAATGQRAQAMLEYERCRTVLRSRLDLEPAPETQRLYRDLRRAKDEVHDVARAEPRAADDDGSGEAGDAGGRRIVVRSAERPPPLVFGFGGRPSVAILPFVNTSGDAEQEYFADGLTDEAITALACWREFPVIARNTAFTYKGRALDVRQVGTELGVRYVVEGSVRRSAKSIRVLTQLIDAATGHNMFATTFDRELSSAATVQEEIAARIAAGIQPELQTAESQRAIAGSPSDFNAYDFYQRGMWHHHRYAKADSAEALGYFQRALDLEPTYTQAMAALVLNRLHAAYSGWIEGRERAFEEAYGLAQRAISLDPRNPGSHFALGMACLWTGRIEVGVKAMHDAIALNPSYAAAHASLGYLLNYCGRPAEAVDSALTAIRLSPYDTRMFLWLPALAGAYYQLRNYEEAISVGRRALALRPDHPGGARYIVAALGQLGRGAEAADALRDLQRMEPDAFDNAAVIRRLFRDEAAATHLLEGYRKAGMVIG